jgi:adenylate kinase family enzyme
MMSAPQRPAHPGRRIIVVGTSGSGKSFVAKRLAEILSVPYVCNDAIHWRGGWTPNPPPLRFAEYELATRGDGWTYDGNIGSMRDPEHFLLAERADTLVWINLPRFEVMRLLLTRTLKRTLTKESLWHGNRETWRGSFASSDSVIAWSWRTYDKHKIQYGAIFADPRWRHLRKIRLRSRAEVNRWLVMASSQTTRCVPRAG